MSDMVLYEVDDGVATITLNRPEQLNTMSNDLLDAALAALEQAADDQGVRAVILTGAGRAFCAGGDLAGMAAGQAGGIAGGDSSTGRIATLRHAMRSSQLLHDMPKATIAQINGPCAGAGLAWACACDLRYCGESAVFNTAFMTAGLSGDFGGTWTLPRILGQGKATELYLLAEKFGSAEAVRIGLVSRSFADADLGSEVRRVARRIGGFAPLALAAIKENLAESPNVPFSAQLDAEAARHIRCGMTEDAREAATAFLEKRPPIFHGQ